MKAVIFPGQGAQYPGMGKDLYDHLPAAREIFSAVDKLSGLNISQACFEGSEEDLRQPHLQQLGILAACLAGYAAFQEKKIKIDFVSGLSLGGHISLYAAGVLDLAGMVSLIMARAQAVEAALGHCPSAMLAVVGLNKERLQAIAQGEGFYLANINTPKQIAIALRLEDKQRIKEILGKLGARVVEIELEGGFHSPLMEEARQEFASGIDGLKFSSAKIPVVTNVTAQAHSNGRQIKDDLIKQLTAPVLWLDCVEFMLRVGVEVFFEIGPSRTLRGLLRKINPKIKVVNIEKSADLEGIDHVASSRV